MRVSMWRGPAAHRTRYCSGRSGLRPGLGGGPRGIMGAVASPGPLPLGQVLCLLLWGLPCGLR